MMWTSETLRAELMKVFHRHAQSDADITEASHLVADLSIDSLGQMEVIQELEDTFHLVIPDEALRELETIADVTKAIETRLKNDGRFDE